MFFAVTSLQVAFTNGQFALQPKFVNSTQAKNITNRVFIFRRYYAALQYVLFFLQAKKRRIATNNHNLSDIFYFCKKLLFFIFI